MKKLILTLALTVPLFAQANDCEDVANLANSVMYARQSGVPLRKIMEKTDLEIAIVMAKQAYKEPKYSSTTNQNNAVNEFENEWYLACLEVTKL